MSAGACVKCVQAISACGELREIKALMDVIYCTINHTAQGIPGGSFTLGPSIYWWYPRLYSHAQLEGHLIKKQTVNNKSQPGHTENELR